MMRPSTPAGQRDPSSPSATASGLQGLPGGSRASSRDSSEGATGCVSLRQEPPYPRGEAPLQEAPGGHEPQPPHPAEDAGHPRRGTGQKGRSGPGRPPHTGRPGLRGAGTPAWLTWHILRTGQLFFPKKQRRPASGRPVMASFWAPDLSPFTGFQKETWEGRLCPPSSRRTVQLQLPGWGLPSPQQPGWLAWNPHGSQTREGPAAAGRPGALGREAGCMTANSRDVTYFFPLRF